VDVANAMAHAHRHLVVHRDVKPGNILVNGEGNVCLLDFGIAKLLDPDTGPAGMPRTRTGVRLLTPAYASPEQLSDAPVTTASDIYQMGLVLHELLTGESQSSDHATRQRDLPPPSECISSRSERRIVKGDLDAIVRRATHPDPERRYASADQMAADLNRYLQGRPVQARPDTLGYRLRKLNQRKPWLAPALTLALLFLSTVFYLQSVYSERLARERDISVATTEFLLDVFSALNPYDLPNAGSGQEMTVVNALNIGSLRARSEFADQPELRAALLRTISEVYSSLDSNEEALKLREEVLQLERDLDGVRSGPAIASLRELGKLHSRLGNRSQADAYLAQQLALSQDVFPAGSPQIGLAEIALGSHQIYYGEIISGRGLVTAGIRKLKAQNEAYAADYIGATILLAGQNGMEDIDESLVIIQGAYELAEEVFGPGSLHLTTVQLRLASTLTDKGEYQAAEQHFRAAIPVLETQLGEDHAATMNALNNLGYLYARRGAQQKAEALFTTLRERQAEKFGPVSRQVADSTQNLAGALTKQGRYDESIPLHWQAHELFNEVVGPEHYVAAFPLLSIAFAELQRGHAAKAEAAASLAKGIFEAAMPDSFLVGVATCLTGLAIQQQGGLRQGQAMVAASRELMRKGSVPAPYPELCGLEPTTP
jgi:serine/threonine-protein kinase